MWSNDAGDALPWQTRSYRVRDQERYGYTYKMANFRGVANRIGNKAKHRIKQMAAAKLHAPKTSSRSHRLTNVHEGISVKDDATETEEDGKVHDLMRVTTMAVQEPWLYHRRLSIVLKTEVMRHTSEETLLFLSATRSRQRGTWSLVTRR